MASTSVHLPAGLIEALDRLAAERGTSRNRIIVEACRDFLDAERGEWPDDMFAPGLGPDELEELREAGTELEQAIYDARRDRYVPPL